MEQIRVSLPLEHRWETRGARLMIVCKRTVTYCPIHLSLIEMRLAKHIWSAWNGMIIVEANAVLDTVQRSINAFTQPKSEKQSLILDHWYPVRFSPLPFFESTIRKVGRRFSFFLSFFTSWIRRTFRDVISSWSQYNERFHIWCMPVSILLYNNPSLIPYSLRVSECFLSCVKNKMNARCDGTAGSLLSVSYRSIDTVLLTVFIISPLFRKYSCDLSHVLKSNFQLFPWVSKFTQLKDWLFDWFCSVMNWIRSITRVMERLEVIEWDFISRWKPCDRGKNRWDEIGLR